jgi:hypothetical protein
MKTYQGRPATLGSTARAGVRLIVWREACDTRRRPCATAPEPKQNWGLLRLPQWLQRRRLHGHDHGGQFWRLRHGHGWRGCGPERDAEGVPPLLRDYAVRKCVAARHVALTGQPFRGELSCFQPSVQLRAGFVERWF